MNDDLMTRQGQPRQHQDQQPGRQGLMNPLPQTIRDSYRGAGKLLDRVAIVTGGDSGIGRAVAAHFAREGAHVAIVYLEEDEDAHVAQRHVQDEGREALLIEGDVRDHELCQHAIDQCLRRFGRLDVLVNNAGEQHPRQAFEQVSVKQLHDTFATNVFGMFLMTQAALPHLRDQHAPAIINTTSVTAYRGSGGLIDYSATKGAIVSFTRSLSLKLAGEGIRVNAVAPGPIWTPLIPSTFPEDKVADFGTDVPMGRVGQPCEVAPAYVYLASEDSSYVTGQVIHINGGEIVNG